LFSSSKPRLRADVRTWRTSQERRTLRRHRVPVLCIPRSNGRHLPDSRRGREFGGTSITNGEVRSDAEAVDPGYEIERYARRRRSLQAAVGAAALVVARY
jgi:hypothetical protein